MIIIELIIFICMQVVSKNPYVCILHIWRCWHWWLHFAVRPKENRRKIAFLNA